MSVLLRPRVLTATIASLAFAAVALPSHAMQNDAKTNAAAATTPASLIVFDQKLDAKSVKLSYVYVPEKSIAVVYADGAESKKPLGTLAIAPGDHRDLKVALADDAAKGSKFWVSLYRDKDGKSEPKADHAYWTDAKLPATNGFVVQ